MTHLYNNVLEEKWPRKAQDVQNEVSDQNTNFWNLHEYVISGKRMKDMGKV